MLNFKWSMEIIPVLIWSLFLNTLQITDLYSVSATPTSPTVTPTCYGVNSVYDTTLKTCVFCIISGDTGCAVDQDCCGLTSCDTTTKTCILSQQTEQVLEYVGLGVLGLVTTGALGVALYVMLNGTPRKLAYILGDSAAAVAESNGLDPNAANAAVQFVGSSTVASAAAPGAQPGTAYDQNYYADLQTTGAIVVAPSNIVAEIITTYPAPVASENPANNPGIALATQNFNRDILVPAARSALQILIANRNGVPFDSIQAALAADDSGALARVLGSNSRLLSVSDNFIDTINHVDPNNTIFSTTARNNAQLTVSGDLATALKSSLLAQAPVIRNVAEWQAFKQACVNAKNVNSVDMYRLAMALSGADIDSYSPVYDNQMADGFTRAKILLKSMPFADADSVIQPFFDAYGNYDQVLRW